MYIVIVPASTYICNVSWKVHFQIMNNTRIYKWYKWYKCMYIIWKGASSRALMHHVSKYTNKINVWEYIFLYSSKTLYLMVLFWLFWIFRISSCEYCENADIKFIISRYTYIYLPLLSMLGVYIHKYVNVICTRSI